MVNPEDVRLAFHSFCQSHITSTCKELAQLPPSVDVDGRKLSADMKQLLYQWRKGCSPRFVSLAESIHSRIWAVVEKVGAWPALSLREASIVSSLALVYSDIVNQQYKSAVEKMDRAIVTGGPNGLLLPIIKDLEALVAKTDSEDDDNVVRPFLPVKSLVHSATLLQRDQNAGGKQYHSIPVISMGEFSAKEFLSEYVALQKPVIIRTGGNSDDGSSDFFPALPSLRPWLKACGHRLVPVELGRPGTNVFGEKFSTLRQFYHEFLDHSLQSDKADSDVSSLANSLPPERVGYVAQHALFDQLPQLLSVLEAHMRVPDEELLAPINRHVVHTNVWLGTRDTVTPLHFDAYENFLGQWRGFKYVRLYAPGQSRYLYAEGAKGEDGGNDKQIAAQGNVSQIIALEDENVPKEFPEASKATFWSTVLCPGDFLYIPHSWWHYVRSLSTSLSINYWFAEIES